MHRRWLVALLIIAALAGLQTFAGYRVQAQADPLPVRVGDAIQVHSQFCRVQQIQGVFLRCQTSPDDKEERWVNLGSASGFRKVSE